MNAEFKTDADDTFKVETFPLRVGDPGPRVYLTLKAAEQPDYIRARLTKSEARAIASALMGAAAEL